MWCIASGCESLLCVSREPIIVIDRFFGVGKLLRLSPDILSRYISTGPDINVASVLIILGELISILFGRVVALKHVKHWD